MAQSIVGTELATTAVANTRRVAHQVNFYWDGTPTDETQYVISWNTLAESADTDKGITIVGNAMTGTARIVLRNEGGRFSQFLTTGPLYSYINAGKMYHIKVVIKAGFYNSSSVAEMLNQFTGYVIGAAEDKAGGTVTLECDDLSLELKNRQVSTIVYTPGDPASFDGAPGHYIQVLVDAVNAQMLVPISYVLDAGRFSIDAAWAEKDNAWREMCAVAEADGGRLYFDHSGVLHYEDPTHLLTAPHTTSQFTFTIANFANLQHQWQWNAPPVNAITVNVTPHYIGPAEVVYSLGEELSIKPGATITHEVEFSNPLYEALAPVALDDYRACTAGGMNKTDKLTIVASMNARHGTLTLTSTETVDTIYVFRLNIVGYPLLARRVVKVEKSDDTSIAQYGRIERTVNNQYIQSQRHGGAYAQMILDRGKDPKQATALAGVPCIPWLELSDRVTAVDASSGTNHAMFIMRDARGIDFSNPHDAKFSQTLTLLPVTSLYPYTDYFEVKRSALGIGADKGRYFY